ncbi:hypothetical protein ACFPAA_33620 [Paraburkholderia caffeinitolerans]|uniref:hypothetical protein n=1 Tax=Paraburkholderia caffeinitolerans TaxID=1723730 RepID=UPI003618E4F1
MLTRATRGGTGARERRMAALGVARAIARVGAPVVARSGALVVAVVVANKGI